MEENEEESEWDQLEFLNEMTVIEKINPLLYLRDGFNFIQNNFVDYHKNLLTLFNKEDMKILGECFRKAEMMNKNKEIK